MVTNLESQNDLLLLIGKRIKNKVECFLIGGSAMMFYGAKDATKDIDLVFLKKKDKISIIEILKDFGYKEINKRLIYIKRLGQLKESNPIILQKDDTRIDLFNKNIICFYLTKDIEDRVKDVYEFNNLIIKVISPEDIILLKCATERVGDRVDALELVKKFNINWRTIIKESIKQSELGEHIFPIFLYDFLTELKESLKADIPSSVLEQLKIISEKEMINKSKERVKRR